LTTTVTEGSTHAAGGSQYGPCADRAKTPSILELFLKARNHCDSQRQHHTVAMTSVYKTLSGTDKNEEKTGEKRNKQRVLILVNTALQEKVRVHVNVIRVREVLHSDTDICCKTSTR
jgi:hypothetical protein